MTTTKYFKRKIKIDDKFKLLNIIISEPTQIYRYLKTRFIFVVKKGSNASK